MRRTFSAPANLALGAGIVAVLAWASAVFFVAHPQRRMLPVFFIFVVLLVALRFGSGAGLAGTVVAATVFAYLLFGPQGSLRIADQDARTALGWLIMGGVSLSFLFGAAAPEPLPRAHVEEKKRYRKAV